MCQFIILISNIALGINYISSSGPKENLPEKIKLKATKKISYPFWQNSSFYSLVLIQVGEFFQIFAAFSEKLIFTNQFCLLFLGTIKPIAL